MRTNKGKRKRNTSTEVQEALLDNEIMNATPASLETPNTKKKRRARRRQNRARLNKELRELAQSEDIERDGARASTAEAQCGGACVLGEDSFDDCAQNVDVDSNQGEAIAQVQHIRRRQKTAHEVRQALDENEHINQTPAATETPRTRAKRKARRRQNRARLRRQLHEIAVHESPLGERSLGASTDGYLDVEEGKQESDDPEEFAQRRQQLQSIREARRNRRQEVQRLRRSSREQSQVDQANASRRLSDAHRRLTLTEDDLTQQRELWSLQKSAIRARQTEAVRVANRTEREREQRRLQQAEHRDQETEEARLERLGQQQIRRRKRRYKEALANHVDFDISSISGKNVVNGRHILPAPTGTCPLCNAWKWPGESVFACCMSGRVVLPPLLPAPRRLREWYEDPHFRELIRPYNQVFAFTSVGASVSNNNVFEPLAEDRSVQGQQGVFNFSIQGVLSHFMGSVLPETDPITGEFVGPPRFAQIYAFDTDAAHRAARRQSIFADLNPVALLDLEDIMKNNPFAKEYISMGERIRHLIRSGRKLCEVVFQLHANNAAGSRTYNLPTATEVAAIMVEKDAERTRDLILYPQGGGIIRLYETHNFYDPLQYPLLFPHGELGWTWTDEFADGKVYRNKNRVPLRAHVAYRLFQKASDESVLHQGGRLFQQYCVDQRAKCEQENLRWIAANQVTLRAELYKGIEDAYMNENTVQLGEHEGILSEYDRHSGSLVHPDRRSRHFLDQVGQKFILPATFTGGPRYMYKQYQDSMAIVREYGKPDLFMTVTCNPKWPEITETIAQFGSYLTAQDRPDVVARVWQQKLKAVLKDLDEGVFGRQIARIYVVEFQKRGLPHAHILIILADDDKPRTRNDYDKFVSAELPDETKNPALYETVKACMLHGPCGELNRKSPCMETSVCGKGFPKPLCEVTQTNPDGYPAYRRRMREPGVFIHNGIEMDNATMNQWVVPYNPWFSQKYNCHINVEVCSTITAVKYLYKYVYKGSDKTEFTLQAVRGDVGQSENPRKEPNELLAHVKARYISPIEACIRTMEFPVQAKTHTVVTLHVHLPDSQFVTFRSNADVRDVLQSMKHTTLTRYFELAASNEEAKQMLYQDIPKLFKWDKSAKKWTRYKNRMPTIGRLVHCSPRDPERFFLRVMLRYRRGPTSFEDLRTVDGEVYATFKEAAVRAGYIENDREWVACMQEAAIFQMPSQLRQLFATILMYSIPGDAAALWNQFYAELSRDFQHMYRSLPNIDEMVKFKTLLSMQRFLEEGGSDLTKYEDLPQLSAFPHLLIASEIENNLIRQELEAYDHNELEETVASTTRLNSNQLAIYEEIVHAVEEPMTAQKLFFVDGPGGTGKSTLLNHILAKIRLQGKIALAVASSGIASLLLPGGRTAHSTFKIPIKVTDTSTCYIPKKSKLKDLIQNTSLIVWDEAPMTNRRAFEAVDRTLRDILDNPVEHFGGKVVVLSGDFRQILPVVPKGTVADTYEACLQASELWRVFKQVHLTENMRVKAAANPEASEEIARFSNFLLEVGEGRHTIHNEDCPDDIKLDRDLIVNNPAYDPAVDVDDGSDRSPIPLGLQRIVDAMYPEADLNDPAVATDEYFANRTILSPTNAAVQQVNEAVADRVQGAGTVYLSTDSIEDEDGGSPLFETELLNKINLNGIPPHKLILKHGIPVMMVRNLNPAAGLCNGTRLRIVELKPNVIKATIMTGAFNGRAVLIPRIIFISDNDTKEFPFRLRRKQFPIVPAFAMTINKAQGQTVHNLGLYLPVPCFAHGQLYVALSRVTSRSKIKVLIESPEDEDEDGVFTKNIVNRSVFQR